MAASCDADEIFRVFTACPQDLKTLILDTRHHTKFKKSHLGQAYCVRVSSDNKALVDHSQSKYDVLWSQGCWWGRHVIVYGEKDLKRDHPVVDWLIKEKQCKSIRYYKEGFERLESLLPFLCTTSVKAGSLRRYPSQILSGLLYLGDWSHAEAIELLDDINVKRVITIHNHPENLTLPPRFNHRRLELPDVECADISKYFNEVYEFIEEARLKKHAVLVHCGAGVSRSATLVIMYLMRHNLWPAQKARDFVVERRSLVCINDGFWRSLCALEAPLGITFRSDPTDTAGFQEDTAEPVQISNNAAGEKVQVTMLTPAELKRRRESGMHAGSSKRVKTEGGKAAGAAGEAEVFLTFAVSKPEGALGELRVGPMRRNQRVVFGRVPACDVVLEHLSVSRQHAALTVDAQGCAMVTDLTSGHGTKLDDAWIKPQVARQLRVGSVLVFGASTRKYKVLSISREGWTDG